MKLLLSTRAYYILILFLFISVIVLPTGIIKYSDNVYLQQSEQERINNTVTNTVNSIDLFIKNIQRSVDIFVENNSEEIALLAEQGNVNSAKFLQLETALKNHFQNMISFTLASNDGVPKLEHLKGFIGKPCTDDIKTFSRDPLAPIKSLHPNPKQHHFDIMSQWHWGEESGIFFINFYPELISDILASYQPNEVVLLLIHKDKPGLIEFSSRGDRGSYERNWLLSEKERAAIRARIDVPGTKWQLVAYSNFDYIQDMKTKSVTIQLTVFLLSIFTGILLFLFLLKSYRKAKDDDRQLIQSKEEMEFLAHHDLLTNLPNRMLLVARLESSLEQMKRNNGCTAVMFLDLDGFKDINDQYGHEAGDHVLKTVADKLRQSKRRDSDTVARLSGDEFVFVLHDIDLSMDLQKYAQNILEKISSPITFGDNQLIVSVSIGISIYPEDGYDIDTLIGNADSAMYEAKRKGKNQYQLFNSEK